MYSDKTIFWGAFAWVSCGWKFWRGSSSQTQILDSAQAENVQSRVEKVR